MHKAAEQAMKGLIVRLWPGDALPNTYFGLVRRFVDACPWLEFIKRSACIKGAHRAFARVKVQWAKLDAADQGRATGGQGASPPRDVL